MSPTWEKNLKKTNKQTKKQTNKQTKNKQKKRVKNKVVSCNVVHATLNTFRPANFRKLY